MSSSNVTRGAADVVLVAGLDGIPFLLDVSRAAFNRMVFNFVWSAVYNVVAILLAARAFVNMRILPAYAGLERL
jgi:Cu2+-exporting ATPase